jgi:phenylacetate-coenzyme A ligase PaaK-like adenylate-forming protein
LPLYRITILQILNVIEYKPIVRIGLAMLLCLKNTLKKAPGPLMRAARSLYRLAPPVLRYGKAFRVDQDLLRESEHWSTRDLTRYQEEHLRLLVAHAYSNVPYYRKIFDARGLKPKDIESIQDLKKLPYLTKEIVRKEKRDLIATNIPVFKRAHEHTSGSTGSPLDFVTDCTTMPMNKALALRHLTWLGYKERDPVLLFREPGLGYRPKFREYDTMSRELKLVLTRSDESELRLAAQAIEEFKPAFISAWPSSLYILGRWLNRNKPLKHRPKFIVTSSENLYPHMRQSIETTFGASVSDWYGQEESVAVAMQCSFSKEYHVQMELGILELAPRDDGLSEIVGTCLHNLAMPFIRYRTGDLALEGKRGTCPCGRMTPTLSEIVGREADFLVTPERTVVSPLGLNYVFHRLDEIKESQIIQEDAKTLVVKIVPWESLSESTLARLRKRLLDHIRSDRMRVVMQRVDEIPRLAGGKRPFVVSHLAYQELD